MIVSFVQSVGKDGEEKELATCTAEKAEEADEVGFYVDWVRVRGVGLL